MQEQMPEGLQFQLLGAPIWRTEHASGALRSKFAALVAYVAVNGRLSRDAVVRRIWPENLDKGRNNLRQHIKRLRESTGHPVFIQGDTIELAPGVDCDVFDRFADWPVCELVARCDFLAGAEFADLPSLNAWIEQQRRRWHAQIGAELVARSQAFESIGDLAQAQALVAKATQTAPWLEAAWCTKMRLHYLAGDHAAAVDAYTELRQQIDPSGAAPSAETQEIWRTIERAIFVPRRQRTLQTSLLRPPRLIGRERQWAAMQGAWDVGRPFLLRGEAGIGKTRLLLDFLRQSGGALVVEGRKGEEQAPYSTLASLLRAAIDQQELTLDPFLRREIGRLLPELGPSPDTAPADQMTLWRAVEQLLQQAAESGVRSIALDDLHFADLASLEALRWLAAGATRQVLHFAFATRPPPDGRHGAFVEDWLTDSQRPDAIELTPLQPAELEQLLETLDLSGAPATAIASDLYLHAGGQPYLLLETLKELALQSATANESALPRPANALSLLKRRILTVPTQAAPLLQLGAVLGADIGRAASVLGSAAAEAMARDLEACGVLRGGRFVHELMRQAAVDALSASARLHWHAVAAAALTADLRVPRARVATLWEVAERWPEAARAYHAAGLAARDAGRLPESGELLRKAVACFEHADDCSGAFEALHDSFSGELHLCGADGVHALLGRLDTLASTAEHAARVAIANATVSISRYARGDASIAPSAQAVATAAAFPDLHCDALAVQAVALAQAARHDEGIAAGLHALALAEAGGQPRKAREIATNLAYIYYEAGRFGDAVAISRKLVEAYRAAGDDAGAGAVEGNLGTLLLLTGDPAGAVAPAWRAHLSHRKTEPSATSPMATINRVALSTALTYLGRFDEALDLLAEGGKPISEGAPTSIRAMAQLATAHVWLLLGADREAVSALGDIDASWPASMQARRCWALARAAALQGLSGEAYLLRIGQLQTENWAAPLAHSPWLEWSRQGDATEVAEKMREVQTLYEQAGMPGTARSAALRRIARLQELDGAEAVETAASLARALHPSLGAGLHASTYLPEAWQTIAQALVRAGETAAAAQALDEARHWIETTALPNVPPPWRDSFLQRNPVNRVLLSSR